MGTFDPLFFKSMIFGSDYPPIGLKRSNNFNLDRFLFEFINSFSKCRKRSLITNDMVSGRSIVSKDIKPSKRIKEDFDELLFLEFQDNLDLNSRITFLTVNSITVIMFTFIGREKELRALEKEYLEDGFSFFPIYGRRRIGKTELIKQFIKDKPHIYFQCVEGTEKENIQNFKEAAKEQIDLSPIKERLEDIFLFLHQNRKERFVIVLDEYPYLAGVNKGLSTRLQRIIDTVINGSNIFLILCGSSVKMMYREVLGRTAPLYGRRTGQIELGPLGFPDAVEILRKPVDECVRIWGVCGGVPYYLKEFAQSGSFFKLIEEKLVDEGSILGKEGEFLLRTELDEIGRYASILKAISLGHTIVGRIVSYCGFNEKMSISPYLNTLERLGLIVKEISIEGTTRSKGVYRLDDEFVRFHMTFIRPYQNSQQRLAHVRDDYNRYLGETFERICRAHIQEKYPVFKVGRWWKKEDEIDIVAVDTRKNMIMFYECKWKDLGKVEARRLKENLERKIMMVKGLDLENAEVSIGIFARSFKGSKNEFDLDLADIVEF